MSHVQHLTLSGMSVFGFGIEKVLFKNVVLSLGSFQFYVYCLRFYGRAVFGFQENIKQIVHLSNFKIKEVNV